MEEGNSVGDLISGIKSEGLTELFSKSVRKPAPSYDYASVPSRLPDKSVSPEKNTAKKKTKKEKLSPVQKDSKIAVPAEKEIKFKAKTIPKSPVDDEAKEQEEVRKQDRMSQVRYEDNKKKVLDPETEARTVFVGNLPSSTQKKQLKKLFSEFGQIDTVRFRGAARPDMKTTKKVAVIRHKFHEDRTNINAYVRFRTVEEAEKSCHLNGKEVEGHAIRVDMALASKNYDNKLAIFLGNLAFKVEEDEVRKMFSKCGDIENVRLIRDASTGIGKGYGYVNFANEDSVGLALRLSNQELCGRKVRVTRAVRKAKPGKLIGSHRQKRDEKPQVRGSKKGVGNTKKRIFKPRKVQKAEAKSFQGQTSDTKQNVKKSRNKTELKNRTLAKKLAS